MSGRWRMVVAGLALAPAVALMRWWLPGTWALLLDLAMAMLAVAASLDARHLASVRRSRVAWLLQAAGPLVWTVAPIAWIVGAPEAVAATARVLAPAALCAAWWLSSRSGEMWSRLRLLIDAGLGSASVFIVGWDQVFRPVWRAAGHGYLGVVAVLVPLVSVGCAVFLVGVLVTEMRGPHRVMPAIFVATLATVIGSDLAHSLGGTPVWAAAWLLAATATRAYQGTSGRKAIVSTRRQYTYAPYALMAPAAAALIGHGVFGTVPQPETLAAVIMVSLLVLRQHVTLTENRALVEKLAITEQRLRHEATHDHLTGLAGRVLLLERLDRAKAAPSREAGRAAIVFIDLDGFKDVNDQHGHAAGDYALVEIGRRLRAIARDLGDDALAVRMSGDEFALVITGASARECERYAAAALRQVRRPVSCDGLELTLDCSIGVAVAPAGPLDPSALMKAADLAMYRAKHAGKGGIEVGEVV